MKRLSNLAAAFALATVIGVGTATYAQHDHGKQGHGTAAGTQVTGQVVDIACFIGHNSSGPKHAKCAEACARAGNPLAIYDDRAKVIYLPVSSDHSNPNTRLMAFIEKRVKVTGKLMEKAGIKGIAIEKVEAAE